VVSTATAPQDVPVPGADIEPEQRVTPLELFFDLVFVFAITQVTALMAKDPTWGGVGHGLLVLALVWWAWTGFAWLTNEVPADVTHARLAIFTAMTCVLIAALAIPGAYGDDDVIFAIALGGARILQAVIFERATRDDAALHRAVVRLLPGLAVTPLLLIVAAVALDGSAMVVAWIVVVLFDYGAPLFAGPAGYRISPGHFAERHGLIVLIAFGESIVAVGAASSGQALGTELVLAVVFGMAVTAALWWAYFDVVALVAERRLTQMTGEARNRMARDSYSYLHLPMIAGIVLLALGIKKSLLHLDEPLTWVGAAALFGGPALYLFALSAFRRRNIGRWNVPRLIVVAALCALVPVAHELEALPSLALLAAGLCALITYEARHFAEARARIRAGLQGR
jgi:low temperature requirement protein LtrA